MCYETALGQHPGHGVCWGKRHMPTLFGALPPWFSLLLLPPTHNLQYFKTLCPWPHTQLKPVASRQQN